MSNPVKVTAIVGSYRKGGVVDTAVDEILASAKEGGAEVTKIYLIDKHIEFCTNCRACTQEQGLRRGKCSTADDMSAVLDEMERSDSIVLASPVNFGTATAVMKRFMERLVCYGYWPWGANAPRARDELMRRRAVVVASSAAPALLVRLATQIVGLLRKTARLLGARTVGVLVIGLAARRQRQELGERARRKARRLGRKLASRGTPRDSRRDPP